MLRRIELTLDIEENHIKLLGWQEIGGQNPATDMAPIPLSAAGGHPTSTPPQPPTHRPAATPSKMRPKAPLSRRLAQQIIDEIAQDNQRIGIQLIGRITQGMMTDPTGVLAKTRADQIFGMLELAELLNLNSHMCEFLENHHAAILRGLR